VCVCVCVCGRVCVCVCVCLVLLTTAAFLGSAAYMVVMVEVMEEA